MKTTNLYLIGHILGPIGGTADYDQGWEKFKDVNGNNEQSLKKIFQEEILPYFITRGRNYKEQFKDTLAYYLSTDRADFSYEFEACLIAFDPPDEPKSFYIWLWEVLFPNDSYKINDEQEFLENYSIIPPSD